MHRVAVIQTAFPGDVVLCTPIFESLKSAGHETTAVIRPDAELLITHNPFIDHIIIYDKRKGMKAFFKTVGRLKKLRCDISISVQRYFKSVLLPIYAGAHTRIGYDNAGVSLFYTHETVYDSAKHEVERCLALCEGLSPISGFSPKVFITDEEVIQVNELLFVNGVNSDNYIVIAPGSVWATKRWGGYHELAKLLRSKYNCDVVLLGSEQDYELCHKVAAGGVAKNLARQTNILQSAAIIKMAKLAITNDSAPAHLAAAVGTPVVTIFGSTVPEFGFAPYTDNKIVVENKNLPCRPCGKHGPMKCKEGHFRCMNDITPQQIMQACDELLIKSASYKAELGILN